MASRMSCRKPSLCALPDGHMGLCDPIGHTTNGWRPGPEWRGCLMTAQDALNEVARRLYKLPTRMRADEPGGHLVNRAEVLALVGDLALELDSKEGTGGFK